MNSVTGLFEAKSGEPEIMDEAAENCGEYQTGIRKSELN